MKDLFLVFSILAVVALPMLIVTVILKIALSGLLHFKQDSFNINGKKIKAWKFCCIRVDNKSEVVKQAAENESSFTKFGAFLRKTTVENYLSSIIL